MIYRVFEETYSGSKIIAEMGTLLLAKIFLKMEYGNDDLMSPLFYDHYCQSWELNSDPEHYLTTVTIAGGRYEIYPVEDKPCLECGQD